MTTNTIGVGGIYSTLQGWEDDAPSSGNLVSAGVIWRGEIKNASDSFVGHNLLVISGMTVNSSFYAELTTATGASFRDNANVQTNALRVNSSNGAYIEESSIFGTAISVQQDYTRISNLQINCSTSASLCINAGGCNFLLLDNCILQNAEVNDTSHNCLGAYIHEGLLCRNTLMIHTGRGCSPIQTRNSGSTVQKFVNCTFVNVSGLAGADFNSSGFTGPDLVNCAVFGFTPVSVNSATTCFTEITAPSGFTQTAFATGSGAQFQDITAGTHDLRIKTGSSLKDAGTTDSTNAANDIAGTARGNGITTGSSYDVGAWEFVSAGAAAKVPYNPWPQLMPMLTS